MTRTRKIDLAIGAGSVVAFLLGLRRVSGLLGVGAGVWYLQQDRKLAAATSAALGAAFVVWPEWPEQSIALFQLYGGRSPAPDPYTVPAHLAQGGKGNADLGGGWVLLDVSAAQSPGGRAMLARGLPIGTVVPLALAYHEAAPVIYQARVIAGGAWLGDTYPGEWSGRTPPGGPQMVNFRNLHVLV